MRRKISATVSGALALMAASPVLADFYSFSRITANATTDVASQLLVEVTDAGGGQVSFNFTNNVGIASSITGIYFDNIAGVLAGTASLNPSAGVSFSSGGSPPDLPGGNMVGFDSEFRATANAPGSHNGINSASESLQIIFDLSGGHSFIDTINALNAGTLVLGAHVQAIGQRGDSDSFITIIPAPGASVLGLIGLSLVLSRRVRTGTQA